MSAFQPPTLRQRAAAASDLAREHVLESETLGHLHPKVVETMQDMSLPQLLKHGSVSTIREFVDVCGILSEGDMSAGWCNFVWGINNYLVGLYPSATQEKVWQNPKTLISGSLSPLGNTDTVSSDGALISGRWSFNAGCDYAEWLLLGFSDSGGDSYLALVHSSEYETEDGSRMLGLRGAGPADAPGSPRPRRGVEGGLSRRRLVDRVTGSGAAAEDARGVLTLPELRQSLGLPRGEREVVAPRPLAGDLVHVVRAR